MKRLLLAETPCWRVIAARHPPLALFEQVASLDEFEALHELEAAFSPHYDEVTLLLTLPRDQWQYGPGSGYVMAPFAYRNPSRFSDGSFGVYYAGLELETAIREVAFHRGEFMARTQEPPSILEEQVLRARISGDLADIRAEQSDHREWYSPAMDEYGPAQALGASLWRQGEAGLACASVRRPGGQCVAILRPRAVSGCRQLRPLRYVWDGMKIAGWA